MTIKDLQEKYHLSKTNFWNLNRGGRSIWIVTHDAVEKIAAIEKLSITHVDVLNSERDFCRMLFRMKKDSREVWTIGEATAKTNCHSTYIGCMAEKRGFDRCVLKMINAYEYGIYSDSESDDFKRPKEEK